MKRPNPGTILVTEMTTGEQKRVRFEDLKDGPVRNMLSAKQVQQAREIVHIFREVDSRSVADMVHAFSTDLNPDKELATWQLMGRVYLKLTEGKKLSKVQKRDYYCVILALVADPEMVHEVVLLTAQEILAAIEVWKQEKASTASARVSS